MTSSDPAAYRARVVERLRDLVHSRGLTVAEVEKRLLHGRGYVNDALRGVKKLTVEIILDVLAALEVAPEEFFERPVPMPARPRPRRGRRPKRLAAGELIPEIDSSSPVVRSMLRLLASKGLLSADDLEEVQRELEELGPPR